MAQMPMTQQFLALLPAGRPQGTQSESALHELGHEPPPGALPPDELPVDAGGVPEEEPPVELLMSPPEPDEELPEPDALPFAVALPSSGG
jgi:hypothetical protein